jgi:cytochrome c oxidase subunit 2
MGKRVAARHSDGMRVDLLAIVIVSVLLATGPSAAVTDVDDIEVIEITAAKFVFAPNEVHTKVGATVEFTLHSLDAVHGFRIIGTKIDIKIPKPDKDKDGNDRPAVPIRVRFTPDKPGRYIFECSHRCGAGHGLMRGVIIVSES